jgi:hypothetical protein
MVNRSRSQRLRGTALGFYTDPEFTQRRRALFTSGLAASDNHRAGIEQPPIS